MQAAGPMPSRSVAPGRKSSISASACSPRRNTVSTPCGFFRSTARLRRPRASTSFGGCSGLCSRTRSARSTRSTSAPISASIIPQNGPGPMPAISMTLIPSSGPIVASPPGPLSVSVHRAERDRQWRGGGCGISNGLAFSPAASRYALPFSIRDRALRDVHDWEKGPGDEGRTPRNSLNLAVAGAGTVDAEPLRLADPAELLQDRLAVGHAAGDFLHRLGGEQQRRLRHVLHRLAARVVHPFDQVVEDGAGRWHHLRGRNAGNADAVRPDLLRQPLREPFQRRLLRAVERAAASGVVVVRSAAGADRRARGDIDDRAALA